ASGACAHAVLREPRHVRRPRAGPQGVHPPEPVRGPLRRARAGREAVPEDRVVMYDLLVIGASWGGLDAVGRVLADFPDEVDLPIVVAQHRHPESLDETLS